MNTHLVFVVLCAVICSNLAAILRSPPSTHKDYPMQCYVESHGKGYTVGEHAPIGECVQITCNSDYSFGMATCGTVSPPEGYHNEHDLTKPYPDCCVHFVKN